MHTNQKGMGLKKRLPSLKRNDALPMCSNGGCPPPPPYPMRQSSDGTIGHQTGSLYSRNMSVSTSMPSVHEYNSSTGWPSTAQSPSYAESVDTFFGGMSRYEEDCYTKSTNSQKVRSKLLICVAIALFIFPWAVHRAVVYRWKKLAVAMDDMKNAHQNIMEKIEQKTLKVRTLEQELKTLERENHQILVNMHRSRDVYIPEDSEYDEMSKYEDGLLNRIASLKSSIQDMSRRDAEAQ